VLSLQWWLNYKGVLQANGIWFGISNLSKNIDGDFSTYIFQMPKIPSIWNNWCACCLFITLLHDRLWYHLHLKWTILNMMKKLISLFMGKKSNVLKPLLLSLKWSFIMMMLIWKEPMKRDHPPFNFNAFFTNQWFILLLMSKQNNVG
jgi:uncharacterized membrane protein (UPF0182 family)